MDSFFAQLPPGKEDKPLLFGMGPLTYDFHDIDGLYFMLDRRLSGCLLLMWAKPMNPNVRGKVIFEGKEISKWVLTSMKEMNGMWILGVPLRGHVTEYSRAYQLHVEGFVDVDGNEMNPQDFVINSIERVEPQEEHKERERIAEQIAEEGIVLLKNKDKILPLQSGITWNLFGKGVHQFRNGAVGAGKINPRYSCNFIEAVGDSSEYEVNEELLEFYGCDEDWIPGEEILQRAKQKQDMAVMFLSRAAGENMDNSSAKGEYYLSADEEKLLKKLGEIFSKVIVILNVGYPIDTTFAETYDVDALVYCGYGGMLGGKALLSVLSGKVNPSGKLPDTWAKDYFDIPASRNFYDCVDKPRLAADTKLYVDTCYEEDIYVGYRYFTTFEKETAYPFGYGLSYTTFSMIPSKVQFDGEELQLCVKVKNTGDREGKEVLQVYIGKPDGEMEKPERELVYFEKTKELQPGEEQILKVKVPKKHMVSYSEKDAAYILEAGEYKVYVGNSVNAPYCESFFLEKFQKIKQVKNRMVPETEFVRLSKFAKEETYPTGRLSGVQNEKNTFKPYALRSCFEAKFEAKTLAEKITYSDVKKDTSKAEAFTAQLTLEELARISVCASAGWGMEGIGEAGKLYAVEGYELPAMPVSDGNSGVNLRITNIGLPSSVTLCATFNQELSKQAGKVIGEEARKLGIPLILAPGMNIHRNPLNGRQPEYFSEDPYLAGKMAGLYCQGMEETGTASCIKHLLANNCETSRKRNNSIISERAIREIYFRAFEYAMEVHMPASVMTAYNACNGVPTAADEELLQGLLREENGFTGFIMTDWTTYDTVDVASMVQAGNCWITPGSMDDTYTTQIVEGVKNGTIKLERLQENVTSIIRSIARFV